MCNVQRDFIHVRAKFKGKIILENVNNLSTFLDMLQIFFIHSF